MKKFVGILILITLIVPVNAIPYQKNKSTSEQQQAYIDAMNDAKNTFPAYRMIGKSPEYIQVYVDVYQKKLDLKI